eukprot:CAMPEP_0179416302 /NCGR_PEP_ID=MMETSP0799-20121207/6720_1 /TAXON_ID=46947 /ORGANISM="Geminigera cryophila, Strain CCMP2564" /LENGTH=170 /DNA_ID=CAMNT_0021189153 /DNA_START=20 /DNA_END=532 /DNA_ORIENTATION=-
MGDVNTNLNMKPGSTTDIMTALANIPTPIQDRAQVTDNLVKQGFSKTTVMWLLSNLKTTVAPLVEGSKKKRTLEWRFDIVIARHLIQDAAKVDSLPLLNRLYRKDGKGKVGLIRGLDGVQWAAAQLVRYQGCLKNSGRVEEYVIEAGHWIHVMKPDELIAIMAPSLRSTT